MMDAEQEKNWAIACHVSSLAWIALTFVGLGAIPFLNIIAPAAIWYFKKEESKLVAEHGKESLNFQISMSIYGVAASFIVAFVMGLLVLFLFLFSSQDGNFFAFLFSIATGIGLIFLLCAIVAIAIFQIIVVIMAATKAKEGEFYRYPFNLRLL